MSFAVAEKLLAVVVAEQEGEAGQVGAEFGEVVAAVDAHVASEGCGELIVVGTGEPSADEREGFGEVGGVAGVELN